MNDGEAMDAKLTLGFDAAVAERAKAFAEANNISLSRWVEFMLSKVTAKRYRRLDKLPAIDWIAQVAEAIWVRKNAAERDVKKDCMEVGYVSGSHRQGAKSARRRDRRFAAIEVLDPEAFLLKHVVQRA